MDSIDKLVETRLGKYGDLIVTRIRERLLEHGKLATGELYNSVTFKVVNEGGQLSLDIYASDYMEWVDQGRKPGKQPPFRVILDWVKLRGLRPKPASGIPERDFGLRRTDYSLAFLIGRKIGLEGIKPTGALTNTLAEVKEPLIFDINEVIISAITEILGADLESIAQEINSNVMNMVVQYNKK